MAIQQGYKYILLEKPIDPSIAESVKLAEAAKQHQVNIQVCHSFVRGDWGDTTVSSPMIMAKCCHDMDLIVYLTGTNCKSISSYGALTHFKPENAPEGSTERCIDIFKLKDKCPYNAIKIYQERKEFRKLACEKEGFTDLDEALRKGRFGRCVYRCGNNAVDHQTVNILLEDDITVALTMSAFSHRIGRDIRIMGTMGEIFGSVEDSIIHVHHFASGDMDTLKVAHFEAGHSGADEMIMRDFVRMVATGARGITAYLSVSRDTGSA